MSWFFTPVMTNLGIVFIFTLIWTRGFNYVWFKSVSALILIGVQIVLS